MRGQERTKRDKIVTLLEKLIPMSSLNVLV